MGKCLKMDVKKKRKIGKRKRNENVRFETKNNSFCNSKQQCLIKHHLFRNQSSSHESAVMNAMSIKNALEIYRPRTSSYID